MNDEPGLFGEDAPKKKKISKKQAPPDPMMRPPEKPAPKMTNVRKMSDADILEGQFNAAMSDDEENFTMKSRFIGGPADKRMIGPFSPAPVMLRVVRDAEGNWDALNEPDDTPKPQEQVFVYRLNSIPRTGHASCRPRSKSFWWSAADYVYHDVQPDRAVLADTERWRAWCDGCNSLILARLPAELLAWIKQDDGKDA